MQSHKTYKSIETLPLWNYIRVVETNDLRYLLILDYYDDLPTTEVDPLIWENIMFEYFDSMDSQKAKNYVKQFAGLLIKRRELQLLIDSLFVLGYKKDPDIVLIVERILKKYNPSYKFDQDKYYDAIIEADRQRKGLQTTYELKEKEFSSKYMSNSSKKVDIYKVIDAVQKHTKLLINPRQITVRQFSSMVQNMNNEITAQNGRTTRNKGTRGTN